MVVSEPDDQVDQPFPLSDQVNESSFFSFSLPKNPIEVVKRYKDWCVLSVARGNGPRAVEKWIAVHEALCFEQPILAYGGRETNSTKGDPDEDEPGLKNGVQEPSIVPVLANPHNAACARALLLVARDPALLKDLTHLRITVHCLVKGHHRPGTEIQLSNIMDRRRCRTTATCLEVVPSNSVGYISLLAAYNNVDGSTFIGPRQFRQHLQAGGWPVLGASRDCYAFRGEKMCLSVVGLEFEAKGIENRQSVTIPPVPKLRRILEKEERFWRQRQGVDDVRVELFGSELPKPVEYLEEKAMFDGLEFRVTPEVMIPRKGSEALIEIVDAFFRKKECPPQNPLVLDLGTGCGSLLLAILKRLNYLNACGVALDASGEALQLCDYNIAALGMNERAKSIQGRFENLHLFKHDPFDAVVCNPPYMTKGGRRNMDATAIAFEPERALYVDRETPNVHYENILYGLVRGELLVDGALVVFEVCKENAEAIMHLMTGNGITEVKIGRDWKKCIRTVEGVYFRASSKGHMGSPC